MSDRPIRLHLPELGWCTVVRYSHTRDGEELLVRRDDDEGAGSRARTS